MKIIMIRHGEPDYSKDALTEKGEREAACLAKWIRKIDPQVSAYYVSPLGRAMQTCNVCLSPLGKEATVLPWIEEYTGRTFYVKVNQSQIPDSRGDETLEMQKKTKW